MTLHVSQSPVIRLWLRSIGREVVVRTAVSLEMQRSLDNPVATASFSLKGSAWGSDAPPDLRGRLYRDTIDLFDLCRIDLYDRQTPPRRWPVLVGLVQAPDSTDGLQESGPFAEFRVTVQGLGVLIKGYPVFWHAYLKDFSNFGGLGFLARTQGKLPQGRPDQVLTTLFQAFINDKYLLTLPDGRKLFQVIGLDFEKIPNGAALTAVSAMGAEGSLWDILKRYADAPWNELFVDVPLDENDLEAGESDATREDIRLRPAPLSVAGWDRLAAQEGWVFDLLLGERTNLHLARNVDKLYNFFWATGKAELTAFDQLSVLYNTSGGRIPRIDAASVQRYGYRKLEVSTEYIQFRTPDDRQGKPLSPSSRAAMNTTKGTLWEMLVERTEFLHQMQGFDGFEEGQVTTIGRVGLDRTKGARIGGIVRFSDGREGYITGISHLWGIDQAHQTTLTLSHVHRPKAWREWWESVADPKKSADPNRIPIPVSRI